MGHLKWVLEEFLKSFFEVKNVKLRMRPSFFPFTEPSMEVDVQCRRQNGEIRFGEGDDWMEILGCGMVHPNVLSNCGHDPDLYQGFAFGVGIDRLTMLKYGMSDLRAFFEADAMRSVESCRPVHPFRPVTSFVKVASRNILAGACVRRRLEECFPKHADRRRGGQVEPPPAHHAETVLPDAAAPLCRGR